KPPFRILECIDDVIHSRLEWIPAITATSAGDNFNLLLPRSYSAQHFCYLDPDDIKSSWNGAHRISDTASRKSALPCPQPVHLKRLHRIPGHVQHSSGECRSEEHTYEIKSRVDIVCCLF